MSIDNLNKKFTFNFPEFYAFCLLHFAIISAILYTEIDEGEYKQMNYYVNKYQQMKARYESGEISEVIWLHFCAMLLNNIMQEDFSKRG